MIRIKIGGLATAIIGILWASVALYDTNQNTGFTAGFSIAIAGVVIALAASLWEDR